MKLNEVKPYLKKFYNALEARTNESKFSYV